MAALGDAQAERSRPSLLLPWLFAEAFVQVEDNQFQRLTLRQLDGVGVRFGIIQQKVAQLFYGTAWMLDWEKLSDDGDRWAQSHGQGSLTWRLSCGTAMCLAAT